jgi:hypothetical protein
MRLDLHVHTRASPCSVLGIPDILPRARTLGLDGVCLTDHDLVGGESLAWEGVQEDGLVVLVGMEYSTSAGDFLVFGPVEDLPTGLAAREMLPRLREMGGAAVAAHPSAPGGRRTRRSSPWAWIWAWPWSATTAATWSTRTTRPHPGGPFRPARHRRQRCPRPGRTGPGRDPLPHPVRSRSDLVQALLAGHCVPELTARGRRRFPSPDLQACASF